MFVYVYCKYYVFQNSNGPPDIHQQVVQHAVRVPVAQLWCFLDQVAPALHQTHAARLEVLRQGLRQQQETCCHRPECYGMVICVTVCVWLCA
jgi:aspartate/methionine/tyrosine aminotransferase